MVEIARIRTIYCDKCGPHYGLDTHRQRTIIGWASRPDPPYKNIRWLCVECSQEENLLW